MAESLVSQNSSAVAEFFAILQVQLLKSEDLVIRKLFAITGVSAILMFAIAGFYCSSC